MGGAAARLHGLARWLVRFGHQVTVITGFPNYPSGIVPALFRGKLKIREKVDGVDVLLTWIYASSHYSPWRRLANYLSSAVSATLAGIIIGRSYDLILTSSPPLFVGLAGWAVSRLHRIPFVFDIRDIWPDVAIEAGEFSPHAVIIRLSRCLARFIYKRASHITPVTENKRKKLLAERVPSGKLTVVPNGADIDLIQSHLNGNKRIELGLEGKFIVLYAGLIGIAQGVEIAVEAANLLKDIADIHFLIIGDGVLRNKLVERVKSFDLNNVTILQQQPRENIQAFVASSDVCLVPLVNGNLRDAVPSKLLEAWAYSRPVILAANGESAALVREIEGGVVVTPKDSNALADAVLTLKNDRQSLISYSRKGHEYVREHLDRRILAKQMELVFKKVLKVSNSRYFSHIPSVPEEKKRAGHRF
jgi:glycosyltransferase involved in cell wall biosynthesis